VRDYHYDDVDVKNDRRYSWRKRYQRGYGEESASPRLKKILDSRPKNESHEIEPFVPDPEKREKDEDGYEIPSYDIDRTWRDIKGHYE